MIMKTLLLLLLLLLLFNDALSTFLLTVLSASETYVYSPTI